MYNSTLLFLNMGTTEIMVIMFAVLLLFGGKKLPELARGLGQGIREFKDASDGVKREIHNQINTVNEVPGNGTIVNAETFEAKPEVTSTTETAIHEGTNIENPKSEL